MEFKEVKLVGGKDVKSTQEIEAELLAKKEAEEAGKQQSNSDDLKIKDEDVLNFIKQKTGKEVSSFDDLFKVETKEVVKEPELPEDVKSFFDFKKETGRGLKDFIKIQTDFDSVQDDVILKDYYKETREGLDDSDIDILLKKFNINEDDAIDDDEIASIKIAKKEEIVKAKKYFNDMKSKYKAPLELSGPVVSDEDKSFFEEFKQYKSRLKSDKEESEKRSRFFTEKTDQLLGQEFKGFEFDIDGKKILFNPGSPEELKKNQSSPLNLVKKFIGEDGLVSDVVGYHKSMAAGMNPDKFAKHFFEMGQHFEKTGFMKGIKNVDLESNKKHVGTPNSGFSVKVKSQDSRPSGRLVIKT